MYPPTGINEMDPPLCGSGQQRFKTDVTFPIRTKVVDVPKPLPAMEPQITEPHMVGIGTAATILSAMDVETVQMLVTPGKQDLQNGMELRQGGMAMDQHATPDERADAAQDDPQLVDAEGCSIGSHMLRVAQRIGPLKGSPRY